jgi:hypothetical protein
MANKFYNRIIRKMVVGFGNLFDNITLVRYNPDLSEQQRLIVPIAYASKEDYVMRLQQDYNLNKKVQITLPRFSFEMTGFTYDSSRKQNTNTKSFVQQQNGSVLSQYNPVPYNFDFDLHLYVRNIEDGTQILEHILSYFTPDYTLKLNLIPEMGIVKEIPVVLNSTSQEIQYEGDHSADTRVVIWTLNFTVKGFIFGATNAVGLIRNSITNVYDSISPEHQVEFYITPNSGTGNYQIGEIVYQGYSLGSANATAIVVSYVNNILTLKNINGNFVSSLPIIGSITNASHLFSTFNLIIGKQVKINTVSSPLNANAADPYTANTTITEYPY